MSVLGKRLKLARNNAGLTQIDAAKKLGISNGTLSGYERNYRDPDTDTLNRMANMYDVSVDWLLGKTASPNVSVKNNRDAILHKIAKEFPDIDLMFEDLQSMNAEQLKEVYNFIKYTLNKKGE